MILKIQGNDSLDFLFCYNMAMRDLIFDELKERFAIKGKRLYLVGGSVRDLLLNRPYIDHDMVTDATPEEMKEIVPEGNYVFAKYGSVRLKINNEEVDITTLREEGKYDDSRHPSYIKFITDPKMDAKRRDFTINAMYLDENYSLLDFFNGKKDLEDKIIRFIGKPEDRIKEDPLRILRAERFAKVLGFEIEKNTMDALEKGKGLLSLIKPEKINEEKRKASLGVKL